MAISYIPNQDTYKEMTPFRRFVLESFPWIDANFDALTNYELMGKIIEYLNNIISNENTVQSNVTNLYNAFVSLNNYVSDYFDNLDVQDEINQKLDEMVTNGELENIVNDIFLTLENQIGALSSGSPAGVYSTVSDLETADPNHDRIYVVTANNNWYYWDVTNEEWASGGLYLSNAIGESDNIVVDLNGKIAANKNQLDYLFSKSIQYKDNSKLQYGKYYSNSNLVLADNSGYTALAIENIPAGTYYYNLRITAALCYIKNLVTGEIKKLSEISVSDNPTSETRTLTINYDFSLYLSMNGSQNSDWIPASMFANDTLPSKYVYKYYNVVLNDIFDIPTDVLKISVDMNSKKINQVFQGDYQFLDKTQFDFGHYYSNENLNKSSNNGYSTIDILNLLPGTYYWKNCTLVPGLSYIKNLLTNEMIRMDHLTPTVPTAEQDQVVNYTFNFPFSLYITVTGSQNSVWLQNAMFANNHIPSAYVYGFYNTNVKKETNIIVGSSNDADFSSIASAVSSISSQAGEGNVCNILLEDGTYNEVNITLPSYVNIIGISGNKEKVIIAGKLPETASDSDISSKSTFNITGTNTFKNVTITGQNLRYPIHSESGGSVKDWKQIVENCFIEHKGNQEVIDYRTENNLDYSNVWTTCYAWGEGASSGGYAKFENTTFKSVSSGGRCFYIHEAENMQKPYYHILKNCTFDLKAPWGVQVCESRSGNKNNTFVLEDCNFLNGCGLFIQGTYQVNIVITNCGIFPFLLQTNLYDPKHFPKFTGEYTRLHYVGTYELTGGEFLKYVNNATEVDVASSTDNPKLIAGYCVGTPDSDGYVDVCQHKVYQGYVNPTYITETQINNTNHKIQAYSSGNKLGVSYPNALITLTY